MLPFTIDWPNQIVGFFLGIAVGLLADRFKERRRIKQLQSWYGGMSGSYENVNDRTGSTGGWIQISQNPDGSFTAVGKHENSKTDWTSEIHMSLKARNVGTGHYRHPREQGIDHGEQTISYYPETGELHVRGRNTSAHTETQFFHTWRPLPRRRET
jgi:hypothetical protein